MESAFFFSSQIFNIFYPFFQPEQLKQQEQTVERLEKELENHRKHPPEKSSKNLVIQNYNEKESFLCYEVRGFKIIIKQNPFCAIRYRGCPLNFKPST